MARTKIIMLRKTNRDPSIGRRYMREQGRVRWKRFALIFIPSTAVASLLLCATVQGAVGASFVVAGETIKVSADEIRAWGVSEFGDTVQTKDGSEHPVYVTALRRSEADNLCQSYLLRTPLGPVTIRLTGGTGGEPVRAENQVIYAIRLESHPRYTGLRFGRDASTLPSVPGVTGPTGAVGQYASTATVRHSRQLQLATSAWVLDVPDSSLRVLRGEHECF
jgi:hypothetical protein